MSTIINEDAPEATDVAQMDDTALDAALQGKETEEATQEVPEGEEKPKFVPHAALHEEREKRKAIERKAAELEAWQRQMMERFQAAEARRMAQEEEAQRPKIPAVDEDPIGHITGKLGVLEETLTQSQQALQQQAEAAAWNAYVERDRAQFTAQNPDFEAAANHLVQARAAQYQAIGFSGPELQQALNMDAQGVAARARALGQSPHQMIYNLAMAAGYQKAATEDAAAKLDTIQRGQETTRTAGAGRAKAALTPADLLNMSPADFERHWDSVMRG